MASIKEDTITHLDFTVEPPCESTLHEGGGIHSGPAGFWQDGGRCAHVTGFRCSSYVRHVQALPSEAMTECMSCGALAPAPDLRFTSI